MPNLLNRSTTLRAVVLSLVVLFSPSAVRAQKIDLNGNGMSDVWELLFGAAGLAPSADADGDGVSNALESLAGTDPFDSNSVPRLSFTTPSSTNFTLSLPC